MSGAQSVVVLTGALDDGARALASALARRGCRVRVVATDTAGILSADDFAGVATGTADLAASSGLEARPRLLIETVSSPSQPCDGVVLFGSGLGHRLLPCLRSAAPDARYLDASRAGGLDPLLRDRLPMRDFLDGELPADPDGAAGAIVRACESNPSERPAPLSSQRAARWSAQVVEELRLRAEAEHSAPARRERLDGARAELRHLLDSRACDEDAVSSLVRRRDELRDRASRADASIRELRYAIGQLDDARRQLDARRKQLLDETQQQHHAIEELRDGIEERDRVRIRLDEERSKLVGLAERQAAEIGALRSRSGGPP